jgi:hypothetical protein
VLAAEVEAIEAELRRIDARISALRAGGQPRRRRPGTLTWQDFVPGPPVEQDDGDAIARECLAGKRDALIKGKRCLKATLVAARSLSFSARVE